MRELSALIAWLCGRSHRGGSREPKGEGPLRVNLDRDGSRRQPFHDKNGPKADAISMILGAAHAGHPQ
jgi:hypothetical protein